MNSTSATKANMATLRQGGEAETNPPPQMRQLTIERGFRNTKIYHEEWGVCAPYQASWVLPGGTHPRTTAAGLTSRRAVEL